MKRVSIVTQIGQEYLTSNIENGEYSYVKASGSKKKLVEALGYTPEHYKLDIRFKHNDVVILVETKQDYTAKDEDQLREYLKEEQAVHNSKKIIAILANTNNDQIRVWKWAVDEEHLLTEETVLDTMAHYEGLFLESSKQNDREKVLKNTYVLNQTLHKKDIDEKLRSQFVGTAILYINDILKKKDFFQITEETRFALRSYWETLEEEEIRKGIETALTGLLENSAKRAKKALDNKLNKSPKKQTKEKIDKLNKQIDKQKEEKITLLQKNVLTNQKVINLKTKDWVDILDEILWNIYRFINTDSPEGQDILNLFFVAFNKYTGKDDKNQAFTPDHITHFMCRVTGVDHTKRLFDGTCGSGAFLVQGMVLELSDINQKNYPIDIKEKKRQTVTQKNIYGIEIEGQAFGLATTNMLIHGDGNSNIIKDNLFYSEKFIINANPDIILMNPPFNAKPINIPETYKKDWKKDSKEDPTKGMVFLKFISDVIKRMNEKRSAKGKSRKEVKIAILLPVQAAIGTSNYIATMKKQLLEDNTLEAVFTLPNEIFDPGSSAIACCMVFTLGKPHKNPDGTANKTFFGYYKEDGHKKKKNLGRVEQFDKNNNSLWKPIEEKWLDLYRNKTVEDGISAMQVVTGDDEWLCEAFMKTDYSKLSETDFQQTLNNYLAYLVKEGNIYEA